MPTLDAGRVALVRATVPPSVVTTERAVHSLSVNVAETARSLSITSWPTVSVSIVIPGAVIVSSRVTGSP